MCKIWNVCLNFKNEKGLFTAFKKLYKPFRCKMKLGQYETSIYIENINNNNDVIRIEEIIKTLKSQPQYFKITLKKIETLTIDVLKKG